MLQVFDRSRLLTLEVRYGNSHYFHPRLESKFNNSVPYSRSPCYELILRKSAILADVIFVTLGLFKQTAEW
jgi:hypothetical protein